VKKAAATPPSRERRRTKEIPPDKVGKGGNTALLTTALADRLVSVVSTGVPLDVAIAYVGIHRETLRRWRKRGDRALELGAGRRSPTERRYADFVQRLDVAVSQMTVRAQATVGLIMSDTDKRLALDAAKFYLSRRERKHYGVSLNAEISGPNGGPILSADMSGEEAWEAFTQIFGQPNDVEDE
jgi:hypothetical protein